MTDVRYEHHEIVNALAGVVALCDVTLEQLGNRARARAPLSMIRRSLQRFLRPELTRSDDHGAGPLDGVVLVVDRDPLQLFTLESELRSLGLVVMGAPTPDVAARLLAIAGDAIDLVLWTVHDESVASVRKRLPDGADVLFLTDTPLSRVDALEHPVDPRRLREAVAARLCEEPTRMSGT